MRQRACPPTTLKTGSEASLTQGFTLNPRRKPAGRITTYVYRFGPVVWIWYAICSVDSYASAEKSLRLSKMPFLALGPVFALERPRALGWSRIGCKWLQRLRRYGAKSEVRAMRQNSAPFFTNSITTTGLGQSSAMKDVWINRGVGAKRLAPEWEHGFSCGRTGVTE